MKKSYRSENHWQECSGTIHPCTILQSKAFSFPRSLQSNPRLKRADLCHVFRSPDLLIPAATEVTILVDLEGFSKWARQDQAVGVVSLDKKSDFGRSDSDAM